MKLKFKEAIDVSQLDQPDLLFIQIDIGHLYGEEFSGLQSSIIKYSEIPRQMSSEEVV